MIIKDWGKGGPVRGGSQWEDIHGGVRRVSPSAGVGSGPQISAVFFKMDLKV